MGPVKTAGLSQICLLQFVQQCYTHAVYCIVRSQISLVVLCLVIFSLCIIVFMIVDVYASVFQWLERSG